MSYVAAATTSIQISPNVLNLPLRPAPVTARAAASLDLLSGGRFNLGLGAGGFWDAIEAMGGRRLTPGQAVDALSEAIDIMRGTPILILLMLMLLSSNKSNRIRYQTQNYERYKGNLQTSLNCAIRGSVMLSVEGL
jgi:hypothetical protein